jgi:cytochrome P450
MSDAPPTELFLDFDQYHLPIGPDGTPLDEVKRLRDRAITDQSWVGWCRNHGGFWLVAGWDESRAVFRDSETFSSREAITPPFLSASGRSIMLVEYDGERHTKYRRLVQEWFSPIQVATLAESLRRDASALIDNFVERGSADFARELGWLVPRTLVARLVGLPHSETANFAPWVYAITHGSGLNLPNVEQPLAQMRDRFQDLLKHRRGNPSEDIMSVLINEGEVDGAPLSDEDLLDFFEIFVVGTLENTSLLLSDAMWHLAGDPALRRRLVEEPDLLEPMVDELLRYFSPASGGSRVVTKETTVGGVTIPAGDTIFPYLPLVNRDLRQFADPDKFIPDRTPNRHLALSNGVHRCLGAHLIRVEVVSVLRELLRRIPDFELDPAKRPEWVLGGGGGMESVPMVFEPGKREG